MNHASISDALHMLTTENPSYEELVDLYNKLRRTASETAELTVARRALSQILGEFIDYLDFVMEELEKSVGLSRKSERERLLASLEDPRGATPLERVSGLIHQWESLERYTNESISASVEI